ncbi:MULTISPECIES: hypothetical protein [Rhodoferax]|uniref:Uncharacterized protein n=1 Tax=Rhodoferax fermentans TaxID=28066 RepID=A0A1T1AX26_RHOFE|nr:MULTISPECIES: hypothetical protein [Rhodoferax]MBK1682558.1 hypothetical protein [Rhodoferax fermentans]MBT3066937.1 hypothetical protein [Rhodoferax sp. U11-2br]OOV08631.1 hypothetical protein RF819_19740 [Rhodoferax fermentans]
MSPFDTFAKTTSQLLSLPFDLARANYAAAVRLGLIKNSLLNSARFEQRLGAAERLTLGPWARKV